MVSEKIERDLLLTNKESTLLLLYAVLISSTYLTRGKNEGH
jgi:hypothetical protein